MKRISTAIACTIIALTLFVPAAYTQDQGNLPLGDAAREQREIQKHRPPAAKRYTNQDVVTTPAMTKGAESVAPLSTIVEEEQPTPATPESAVPEKAQAQPGRTVMDRVPDPADATIIVPAGTQIKVDVSESKVIVPVRVGFATPIPALSKVTVGISRQYLDEFYQQSVQLAQLTSVTVEGTTYQLETDEAPVAFADEATFTLLKPVTIKR